jgi:hypothetical protein
MKGPTTFTYSSLEQTLQATLHFLHKHPYFLLHGGFILCGLYLLYQTAIDCLKRNGAQFST